MISDPQVLVVGAGPTGLLLASEVQRRGVDCLTIDAHPEPLHWDRATVIHPRSLEVFESLGLVEPLLEKGVKQRVVRVHSEGRILGELDLSSCGSRYGFNIGISEEMTESILTDYLHQQGGEILRSSRLVELAEEREGVVATIQHGEGLHRASVEWVVGCDGFHSTTRELSGIELVGHDIEEPWAVFDATVSGWPHSYEGVFVYLEEIPVILTALPEQRWRVYLRPRTADSDLLADASEVLDRYVPAFHFEDLANPTRFHCHTKVATRFRSGRFLLAGDAAHVCTPAEGHGMNCGLQDAFNLAWKLALVCQGQSPPSLLDSYDAERHPVAEIIAASGDAAERIQTLTDPTERRNRNDALCAMFADSTSRHHEIVAEAELNIDYKGSPIVMGDHHERLAPGQRIPDTIEIALATGKTLRLHELTQRAGHTVLVIGGSLAASEHLVQLDGEIQARGQDSLIEAIFVLTTDPGGQQTFARITPAAADELGIREVTLLAIRPDGHVGLRADDDHLNALKRYHTLLTSDPSGTRDAATPHEAHK